MPRTKKPNRVPTRLVESSFLGNGSPGDVLTLAEAAAYLRLPETEVIELCSRTGCRAALSAAKRGFSRRLSRKG